MRAKLLAILAVFFLCNVTEGVAGSNPVIVKLEAHGKAAEVAKAVRGRVLASLPHRNLFLMDVPAVEHLITHARGLGIRSFEPNLRIKLHSATEGVIINAGNLPQSWINGQPALALVGRGPAQALAQGRGVVVADINSIVDYSHPALTGGLTAGYDFVLSQPYDPSTGSLNQSSTGFLDQSSTGFLDGSLPFLDSATGNFLATSGVTTVSVSTLGAQAATPAYSHGTLCAGVIRAVAPESMIMPLRAFNDQGETDLFTITSAIDYAVTHGAHVINMSFGLNVDSEAVRTSIQAAQAAGITLIASAGNNNTVVPQFPAAYPNVIAVAATDNTDVKSTFSNYGQQVDVSAPGVNIVSAFPGAYYAVVSGTSFAAPMVAGEAALVRSIQLDPLTTIRQRTVNIDSQNPYYVGSLGTGRISLSLAVGGY